MRSLVILPGVDGLVGFGNDDLATRAGRLERGARAADIAAVIRMLGSYLGGFSSVPTWCEGESPVAGRPMTGYAIPDDVAGIIERLQGIEALDWEVKAARGGIPNSIWETISAFAKTHGGWLVLGVAERNGEMVVEGVADPSSMVRQLHDQIRNDARISYPVCGASDVTQVAVDGHQIVVVRVPSAPRRLRPIYTRGNPYSGTYVRRNEGDYPATRIEVDRMMREASEVSADQVILSGYSWDDLDLGTLQRYRRRFLTARRESPHNSLDDTEFLGMIGGYRRERETGREGITVAGLLMFGKDEPIRSWRGRHLLDFRTVAGDPAKEAQTDWLEREVWEGNLLGAFETIAPRLMSGLPVPFGLVDGVRLDQSEYHIAIREAFVNLFLHADYSEQAVSLIVRSPGGFFFRNPGNSRVPDLGSSIGDRSDPRNPELVRMFRYIGLAEEAGSGVPRIFQAWRRLGYEAPIFDLGASTNEFTAELRFKHLLSEDDKDWIESLDTPVTQEEQVALLIARHAGWVDNGSLRQVTNLHPVDVTHVLGRLRDTGLLRMVGGGRGAKYQLDPLALELAETSTADSARSTTVSARSTADSAQPLVDSPIWSQLEQIAEPVSSVDYISSDERNNVVVRLCAQTPLSLLELSWLLGRNKRYVRSTLKQLVDEGKLAYLYPDKPRHPDQRYRAVHDSEKED